MFIYLLQVYAPCSRYPINVYRDFIDSLHVIISTYSQTGLVIVMGDFNAHLQGKRFIKNTDVRGRCLLNLMHTHNMVAINTLPTCTGADSSFISYGDLYESLIDHFFLPVERIDTVLSCEIMDDNVLNVSRHLPIVCCVSVPRDNLDINNFSFPSHIKWDKLTDETLHLYRMELEKRLFAKYNNSEEVSTTENFDRKYTHLVNSIITASDTTLPKTKFKPYLKPYWDRVLKDLHAAMREKRRIWISHGRPRGVQFETYKDYKSAKALFRAHHRRCAENFLIELNSEIDQAAELDSAAFWKRVNYRRKTSHTSAGCEIKFCDVVCRDPAEIASGWGQYFRNLYSDVQRDHFDAVFHAHVEQRVKTITETISSCERRDTVYISADEVSTAVKRLKCKKACGHDRVCNEHLINGGPVLYDQLAMFYTEMFNHGYIPKSLKQGIIITLHKGVGKTKTDPNNYRAITLSSAILKLFERLLLEKVESGITKPLNWLQGGFRPNIGCNMTSAMLRECILYARENRSKLYVCYLDVQKAFDRVWHSGLFLKLYEMGLSLNLLKIVIELHRDMTSCVLYKGHKSEWFDISQGTRQGGVLSPFLYLCFANDLLEELSRCTAGLKMFGYNISCPAVA
ncbi:MAG: reverse transcriptase domain-containing protein, partial [Candidatus Thiodiazotropha endolucinida]|nr:hypothetical protein [Candidatus Thiodiazotropha taylori]MCW4262015.1 reverse transcriptase domain-containing protein [Candidatus Thiodiazotropha endolucinida]